MALKGMTRKEMLYASAKFQAKAAVLMAIGGIAGFFAGPAGALTGIFMLGVSGYMFHRAKKIQRQAEAQA